MQTGSQRAGHKDRLTEGWACRQAHRGLNIKTGSQSGWSKGGGCCVGSICIAEAALSNCRNLSHLETLTCYCLRTGRLCSANFRLKMINDWNPIRLQDDYKGSSMEREGYSSRGAGGLDGRAATLPVPRPTVHGRLCVHRLKGTRAFEQEDLAGGSDASIDPGILWVVRLRLSTRGEADWGGGEITRTGGGGGVCLAA